MSEKEDKPEKYYGINHSKNVYNDPYVWLAKFEATCEANKWMDGKKKVKEARRLMVGDVTLFEQALPTDLDKWEDVKEAGKATVLGFKSRFLKYVLGDGYARRLREEIDRFRQADNERIARYAARYRVAIKRVQSGELTEDSARQVWINGLGDKDMAKYIMLKSPSTFQEVEDLACEYESTTETIESGRLHLSQGTLPVSLPAEPKGQINSLVENTARGQLDQGNDPDIENLSKMLQSFTMLLGIQPKKSTSEGTPKSARSPQATGAGGGTASNHDPKPAGQQLRKCHNCHEPGHFARECPQRARREQLKTLLSSLVSKQEISGGMAWVHEVYVAELSSEVEHVPEELSILEQMDVIVAKTTSWNNEADCPAEGDPIVVQEVVEEDDCRLEGVPISWTQGDMESLQVVIKVEEKSCPNIPNEKTVIEANMAASLSFGNEDEEENVVVALLQQSWATADKIMLILSNVATCLAEEKLSEAGLSAVEALATVAKSLSDSKRKREADDPLKDRRPAKAARRPDTRPIVPLAEKKRGHGPVVPCEGMIAFCKTVSIPLELVARHGSYSGVAFRRALRMIETAELEKRRTDGAVVVDAKMVDVVVDLGIEESEECYMEQLLEEVGALPLSERKEIVSANLTHALRVSALIGKSQLRNVIIDPGCSRSIMEKSIAERLGLKTVKSRFAIRLADGRLVEPVGDLETPAIDHSG